jgi:NHL repeat
VKRTEHNANPAAKPTAGSFATLHATLHSKGTSAPRRDPLAVALVTLCVLCALLAFRTITASAEGVTLVPNGKFRSVGASGVAVDQSSGDVFVTGLFALTETEKPEFELGVSQELEASGKALKSLPEGFYYGAAVNPVNKRLYVENAFGKIEVYDPGTGSLTPAFSVPVSWTEESLLGFAQGEVQIAADSEGDVYVPSPLENTVRKYSESGEPLGELKGSGVHALTGPTGVAVDSSGNVWVADNGNNRIEEFSPTGTFLREFESEGVRTLALDGHGDVFAVVDNGADNCGSLTPPCEHLIEYSDTGVELADVGASDFGANNPQLNGFAESMVAVDEATGRVYVTDGMKDLVWVYQPPIKPTLGQESAVEVGTTEAKLGALVNPGGAQTTYRFEYDTHEYREGEGPHGVSVPFPGGTAGEGFSQRAVWASARNLQPGTTYYYRAVVTNARGTAVGPQQTFTTESVAQAACPNEDVRGGFSAALPDCRAYELVTSTGATSAEPDSGHVEGSVFPGGGFTSNQAADDGDRFAFISLEVMPGSQSAGLEFISTRGADGWSIEDALPLQPYTGDRCPIKDDSNVAAFSTDLSESVIKVNNYRSETSFPSECHVEAEAVEVAPGESPEVENLLLRDNENGSYRLINVTPPGVTPTEPSFIAASSDLSVVIFAERAKLTPEALDNTENLYEWRAGAVRLLRLTSPSGAPVEGSVVDVSADGSEVIFTADGKLYARLNHGERVVQLDGAQGGSGPGGGGALAAVSTDGQQVFFTDDATAGLTNDTVPGSGSNLYRYEVSTGRLSDLTPVADAEATITGSNEDGSSVYFSADGVLTGSQANQLGETAQAGEGNLYLDHDGTITFVTHTGQTVSTVMSSNGAYLAFGPRASSASSFNHGEIYLYSEASNRFECASCNPDGEATTGMVLPTGNPHGVPHPVSDNGQVFFETAEALLPGDTDGQVDVYEFDWSSGLHLISSGTSHSESHLLDVSPSGDDVFFLTRQALVSQANSQEANKIYDARVDGGFPEVAPPPVCATADACRSAPEPQPAIYGAPSSQTFSGAGNALAAAGKPAQTGSGKPKQKKQRKKKRLKAACRAHEHARARCARRARKANAHRGGGK